MEAEHFYTRRLNITLSVRSSRKKMIENIIQNHSLFVISMLYSPEDFKADKISVLRGIRIRHT